MNRYSPDRLAEVNRFLKFNLCKEKELQEIVELAADICASPMAILSLVDGVTKLSRNISGADLAQVKYAESFSALILKKNTLVKGNNAIGLPIRYENGEAIGTLCIFDQQSITLTELQQEMLYSLCGQVTKLLAFDQTHQILKQQYEDSLASANVLLTYYHSSSSCHLLLNKNMMVIAFNQSMERLMFYNHRIHFMEGMDMRNYIHPSFLAEYTSYFNRAMKGGIIEVQREVAYENGKICWLVNYAPAYNSSGQTIGVSINATDITNSVRNKAQISAQIEAIKQINIIQTIKLTNTIDAISRQMKEIASLPGILAIDEFTIMQFAVEELLTKKEKLINLKFALQNKT